MNTLVEEIEQNIKEMFEAASEAILSKDIDEAEFNLCVNTITITIDYLKSKRNIK